jgi:hypothetical protein
MTRKRFLRILNRARANWRHPRWWRHALATLVERELPSLYFSIVERNKGTYVALEQWDNLIILDACRCDMFRKLNWIHGHLECKASLGSSTDEFLERNFAGKRYDDIVYVTANPLVDYWVGDSFHKVVQVWKMGWDQEYGTVLPRTMVEHALQAGAMYPDKRLVIHFVQPHYPFLGATSRARIGRHADFTMATREASGDDLAEHTTPTVWQLLKAGKVPQDAVWEAYEENLQIVLPYAELLASKLPGQTVITSDHGNLFGERIPPFWLRAYGHPRGIHVRELVDVPWLVLPIKNRERADLEKARVKSKIRRIRSSSRG